MYRGGSQSLSVTKKRNQKGVESTGEIGEIGLSHLEKREKKWLGDLEESNNPPRPEWRGKTCREGKKAGG